MSLFGYVDMHGVRTRARVKPQRPSHHVHQAEGANKNPEFSPADVDEKTQGDGEAVASPGAARVYRDAQAALDKRRPVIYAKDIMRKPVICLQVGDSLEDAWGLFKEHQFRHIPVLSSENNLVGLVSDRALLRSGLGEVREKGRSFGESVAAVMKTGVLTASPEVPIREAAQVLMEKHLGVLPILQEKELVGILTRTDILRALIAQAPLEFWV